MEPGRGGLSVLPLRAGPRRQQPALWPTLAALALLSSVAEGEASLGPAPRSPGPREGPTPTPAPPPGPRPPHDLSLANLLHAGALKPPPGSRPVSQPCCRPTSYEAVSFMDVNSTWRTVDRLSATACGCLG
ncbi:Artemin [Bos mutus]|uniref:Artemin n=1 Tax=Bos mutus TaxID=72004 RepID=L8HWF9_9CETA|nr:Artemin [Bos mutus]